MSTWVSQSELWPWQKDHDEEHGIHTETGEGAPFLMTSNPVIASSYAEMIFEFMRDRAQLCEHSKQPVYIVELGAGTGRFSFQLLRHLIYLCERRAFPASGFRYIMTANSAESIDFWLSHRQLEPYTEGGMLDFALFDAVTDTRLSLFIQGETIDTGQLDHPVVVVANFFFEGMPQDHLYFNEDKLFTCSVPADVPETCNGDKAIGSRNPLLTYEPIHAGAYYEKEPYMNELLELYKQSLHNTHLLFPYTAIRCLERLRGLSREKGMLLLSADKALTTASELERYGTPAMFAVQEKQCPLTLNYHAIEAYYLRFGTACHFTAFSENSLFMATLLAVPWPGAYRNTELAYGRCLQHVHPGDFYKLMLQYKSRCPGMGVREIIAWIRLSGYDDHFLRAAAARLLDITEEADEHEKTECCAVIDRVWDGYYVDSPCDDLAFTCGELCFKMGKYALAAGWFEKSRAFASDASSLAVEYNIALCYFKLQDERVASSYVQKVLDVPPRQ
ncbi:hypothetical protein [Paenibacillus thalictri]|uniref:Tetratricopeptide repeat protein n=1 Tax=Paenibacillus thalictri TaxID=2527873 RepID=A0A4Q9DWA3_9BACL|nr:hypothetical protein [Paenibacillus thalictri]TBL80102.1 hypothetical protein EYB31_06655 [Paenibacillus thalictri]